MRVPPNRDGNGSEQRSWHLVNALRQHGDVHFVLAFRASDQDCAEISLRQLEPRVSSITRINIAGWRGLNGQQLKAFNPALFEIFKLRSYEAPHLSKPELNSIAARLPLQKPDFIFAGRLFSAVLVQSLIDIKRLPDAWRVVDFDDILPKFRVQQVQEGGTPAHQGGVLARLNAQIIAAAERRVARTWHGLSTSCNEGVNALRMSYPSKLIMKIPNVIPNHVLVPEETGGRFRILFAGDLAFSADADSLRSFLAEAWPALRLRVPGAELLVLATHVPPDIAAGAREGGILIEEDILDPEPCYRACEAVIVPLHVGEGGNARILAAMAFGRAVVATRAAASGLGAEEGEHLLLADTMPEFVEALAGLARDAAARTAMACRARHFQQQKFGVAAMVAAVNRLVIASRSVAFNASVRRY